MKKGTDRWGDYYDMTGFEDRGYCFWCGKSVKNRRFCNSECSANYNNHFIWTFARDWCLKRAGYKCQNCEIKPKRHPYRKRANYKIITRYSRHVFDRIERRREKKYQEALKEYKDSLLEAHHIEPLLGDNRHINKKNRPENLICLCHSCHNETRKKPKNEKPITKLEDRQLELF